MRATQQTHGKYDDAEILFVGIAQEQPLFFSAIAQGQCRLLKTKKRTVK